MPAEKPVYRPEFIACLRLIAEACDRLVRRGYERPVIVGGAAVEFYTSGAIVSGDFDLVTARQPEFEEALVAAGFVREHRSGRLARGLYHPAFAIGIEVVSGSLFDGKADPLRIYMVDVRDGATVAIAPIEDLIADPMAQHALDPRGAEEMLDQAVTLYRYARSLDETSLDRRTREQTLSECNLGDLDAAQQDRQHYG